MYKTMLINFLDENMRLRTKKDFLKYLESNECPMILRKKTGLGSFTAFEIYTRRAKGFKTSLFTVLYDGASLLLFDGIYRNEKEMTSEYSSYNVDEDKLSLFFDETPKGELILKKEIYDLINFEKVRDGYSSEEILYGLMSSLLGENKSSVSELEDYILDKMLIKANKRLNFRNASDKDFLPLFLSYNGASLFSKIYINNIDDLILLKERINYLNYWFFQYSLLEQ